MNYVTWSDLFAFLTLAVTTIGVVFEIWTKRK